MMPPPSIGTSLSLKILIQLGNMLMFSWIVLLILRLQNASLAVRLRRPHEIS